MLLLLVVNFWWCSRRTHFRCNINVRTRRLNWKRFFFIFSYHWAHQNARQWETRLAFLFHFWLKREKHLFFLSRIRKSLRHKWVLPDTHQHENVKEMRGSGSIFVFVDIFPTLPGWCLPRFSCIALQSLAESFFNEEHKFFLAFVRHLHIFYKLGKLQRAVVS